MKTLSALLLCVFTPVLFAQNYFLDPAYGTNGVLSIDIAPPSSELSNCAQRDQNGNYYIGGYSYTDTETNFAISKVLANGQLDPAFGNGGSFTFGVPNYTLETIRSISIQPDGKVVFAGELYQSTPTKMDAIVGRLLTNGTLDPSFNTTGYRIYNGVNLYDSFQSVTIQNDGKIVAAGYKEYAQYHANAIICRFNSDGSFDNTFATNGIYLSTLESEASVVKIDGSGNIIFAGSKTQGGTSYLMMRLSSNGTVDNTFGNSGVYSSSPCTTGNRIVDFSILPAGDFICAGFAYNGNPAMTADTTFLCQVTANGTLNTSLYNQGYLRIFQTNIEVDLGKLFLRADGSCLLAGITSSFTTGDRSATFCEISASGVFNSSIGTNGLVNYNPTSNYENFTGIFAEGNSVICAGWQSGPTSSNPGDFILTKYTKGTLSTASFQDSNLEIYPNPTDGILFIKSAKSVSTAKVCSLEGKQVKNLVLNQEMPSFSLDDLSPGQYIVTLFDTEGQQVSHTKIIKN